MNFYIQDIEKYTILKSYLITISHLDYDGNCCIYVNYLGYEFKCCFNDTLRVINICEGDNLFAIKNIFDHISSLAYESLEFNLSKIAYYNSDLLNYNTDCILLNSIKIINLIIDKSRYN